jgi:hypothetical protein
MKISKYLAIGGITLALSTTSCTGDLDVTPDDPNQKLELSSTNEWYSYFAQLYAGLVLQGLDGGTDLAVDDGGASVYTRVLWNLEELPTDEALIGMNWDDDGYNTIDFGTWSNQNLRIKEPFDRFMFQIKMCSEFMNKVENAREYISADEVENMKNEARVLRALSYYHVIDLFGRAPWVDENSVTGAIPPTYTRDELFNAVVEDLKDAADKILPGSQQTYGRVSREGAYALLAKLYLNAEVYTGTAMWQECADACKEILKTNNTLCPDYKFLFCATNKKYVNTGEILWAIPQDENEVHTYGGTTYLAQGAINADYSNTDPIKVQIGLASGGWGGPRVRPELYDAFEEGDQRRLIYEGNFNKDLVDLSSWALDGGSGYMCIKYVYTNEDDYYNTQGLVANNSGFNSTDYPLFRLADVYLMLAECQLHGVSCDGLTYLNKVRERAGLNAVTSYTADDLLRERQCELYWEGHRRSDLIRFGKFTGGSYIWQWKGGVYEGTSIPDYRKVYSIPYQYVETVGQNEGY